MTASMLTTPRWLDPLIRPVEVGARRLPPLGLVALAAVGAVFVVVDAVFRWATPSDEYAYWLAGQRLLAGQPLYDPTAVPGTPYAYFYPPPLAQVLAPFTAWVPDAVYVAAWTILLLGCIAWLAGWKPLVALALVAYVPVAVELWYRNVHLLLAVMLVLALRKAPWWFAIAAAIKVTPVLGIVYLAGRGRWRDAAITCGVGAALLALSVAISPAAWRQFLDVVVTPGAATGASMLPVPFFVRAIAGLALAIAASRIPDRWGEALLIVAIAVANPTFWVTALALLVAIVPLVRSPRTADVG